MNLIEQLGGYEKAKNELEKTKNQKYRNFGFLEEALLQYRREHNIFEVGDKVVYDYLSNREAIHTIQGKVIDGLVWIENAKGAFIHERVEYLKHASDEEIKVGYRL
jgi:hypothetical protein